MAFYTLFCVGSVRHI